MVCLTGPLRPVSGKVLCTKYGVELYSTRQRRKKMQVYETCIMTCCSKAAHGLFRHVFEKQKADENERTARRMMEKPSGRRHDAFTDYHQRILMGDDSHGYDAEAVSSHFLCCEVIAAASIITVMSACFT